MVGLLSSRGTSAFTGGKKEIAKPNIEHIKRSPITEFWLFRDNMNRQKSCKVCTDPSKIG
jgi:hypothetical protein